MGPYLESFLVIVESISAIACHAAVTYYYCYNNMYYNSNENYRKLFENTGTKQKKIIKQFSTMALNLSY